MRRRGRNGGQKRWGERKERKGEEKKKEGRAKRRREGRCLEKE